MAKPRPDRAGAGRRAGPDYSFGWKLYQHKGPGPRREEKMGKVLYFAYGSNLSGKQMRTRCATARAVARAVLPNHALAFGGFSQRWGGAVANVVRVRGAHVEGLLYELDRADLQALDRFEGHPFSYERVMRWVLDEHGQRRRATTYLQPEEAFETWGPPPTYLRVLRRAYGRLGFDVASLAVAVRRQP